MDEKGALIMENHFLKSFIQAVEKNNLSEKIWYSKK